MKTLITYFSAEGNTKALAERLAAPNIINTFVKGYDWSGKKVALFATSGGSEMGKTAERLQPYLSGNPEVLDARVFSVGASEEELKDWVESL